MEKKQKLIVNIFYYGLIILILLAACKFILPVLIPFIIAFVIASLLRVPVKKLYGNSATKNKWISVLTCILFYAIVFSILTYAGVNIYNTISDFLVSVPSLYQDSIVPALNQVSHFVGKAIQSMDADVAKELEDIFNESLANMGEYLKTFSVNAIKAISGSLAAIPGFIIKLVITIISTFFCMIDYDRIIRFFKKWIPHGKESTVLHVLNYYKNTIFIYLKSYSLLFLLTYIQLTIGFAILKIPYPLLIALLIAIFDILPVLGVGGILLPWAVILFIMKDIPLGIGMLLLYLVITFIRNTAEPKLVGKEIGLHPLATLIFMYLGLRFLGLLGMFLFPVTLAVVVSMKQNTKDKDDEDSHETNIPA